MEQEQKLATAEWANPAEVSEKHKFDAGDFWLGRSSLEDRTPLGCDNDQHICLVSGNRGGKGTSSILPNLCLWPGSLVVVDPKGENATVTAARRGPGSEHCEGMGQDVHVLDPFEAAQIDPSLRSRFNPLDALDPSNEETIDEAGRIADALVVIGENTKEPFWDEKAREIIQGLILHVLTYGPFEGERNLMTVRTLIKRGLWKAVEALKAEGREVKSSAHALLWRSMSRSKAFHVLNEIGDSMASLEKADAKLHANFLETASNHLNFLDSPAMRRNLEASDFKLSELKTSEKGVSVYLTLPQRYMNSHYRWLRMMLALTISEMEIIPGQPACGHRVLMILDEFAGLKKMDVIENATAQIAGFGVKLFFILQSLAQLKATYQDNWETFLGNCGLKLFFNLEDKFSREYISEFIGETELRLDVHTEQETEGDTDTTSESTTEGDQTNEGGSSSTGGGTSTGGSKGTGGSASGGGQKGSSQSYDWGLDPLFFRNSSRFFSLFRDNERTNEGTSKGTNWQNGSNWQKAKNWQKTANWQTGENWSKGTSRSRQTGSSHAKMRQTGRGKNETLHKRRLITADEIGLHFARVDALDPRYPGLGLALMSGERPAVVQRVNYYEEELLDRRFDPHPDHLFTSRTERDAQRAAEAEAAKTLKTSFGDFRLNGNGTITDKSTGLMWMQAPWGMEWNGGGFVGEPIKLNWLEATERFGRGTYVRGHHHYARIEEDQFDLSSRKHGYTRGSERPRFADYSDWSLPTASEWRSIQVLHQNFLQNNPNGADYETRKREIGKLFPNMLTMADCWSATGKSEGDKVFKFVMKLRKKPEHCYLGWKWNLVSYIDENSQFEYPVLLVRHTR